MQNYERVEQEKRIEEYKRRCRKSLPYFGVFGAVITPFLNFSGLLPVEVSPRNLDLKMCYKLIQEIGC